MRFFGSDLLAEAADTMITDAWRLGRYRIRRTTRSHRSTEFLSCYLCCRHCIESLLSAAMDCARNFCGWQGRERPDGLSRFKQNSLRRPALTALLSHRGMPQAERKLRPASLVSHCATRANDSGLPCIHATSRNSTTCAAQGLPAGSVEVWSTQDAYRKNSTASIGNDAAPSRS